MTAGVTIAVYSRKEPARMHVSLSVCNMKSLSAGDVIPFASRCIKQLRALPRVCVFDCVCVRVCVYLGIIRVQSQREHVGSTLTGSNEPDDGEWRGGVNEP